MKLQAHEFIRRFLLHVIPKGLMRVRHFGFLANNSKERLSKCRQLLGLLPALPKPPQRSTYELMLALTGINLTRCPRCRNGTMVFLAQLPIPARPLCQFMADRPKLASFLVRAQSNVNLYS